MCMGGFSKMGVETTIGTHTCRGRFGKVEAVADLVRTGDTTTNLAQRGQEAFDDSENFCGFRGSRDLGV